MSAMYRVDFKYADSKSNWEWRNRSCQVFAWDTNDAIRICKNIYILGIDCEYEITEVKEV